MFSAVVALDQKAYWIVPVVATPNGLVPAANGDPVTWVMEPVVGSMVYTQTSFEI
jgi:hypothetical protein